MQDQAIGTKRIQENNTLHSHRPVKRNLNINTRSQEKRHNMSARMHSNSWVGGHHQNTWSDSKVLELITMCLLWQQLTETSIWFDDIGISAFHICVVVVDL
jgi:hypothetical protein